MKLIKKSWSERFFDALCFFSLIAIWPRYIEPRLLETSRISLKIQALPPDLSGLKILHVSDLHWQEGFSLAMKKKLIAQIDRLKPDLILFTGDFICQSKLEDAPGFKAFLQNFKAPYGAFAVLGNHDYAAFVGVNQEGNFDLSPRSSLIQAVFRRLWRVPKFTGKATERVKALPWHQELVEALGETPFKVLHNECLQIKIKAGVLNLCGLGEYSLGKQRLEEAFRSYEPGAFGIVLTHHPDSLEDLQAFPGDLILAGHTHGGQVNLPFFSSRFTQIQRTEFTRGLKRMGEKWVYVSRGISSVVNFRLWARPQITLMTLFDASVPDQKSPC